MQRSSTRSLVAATTALLLILGVAAAAPPVTAKVRSSAGHPCLVMTGSGDPAFVKNFNPYAGGGLPSNSIAQGAFYEPLIATSAGAVHTVPWLARSRKWTNANKTLTLQIAPNAKWSDGKPLPVADVVYSLTAGRQSPVMDRIGIAAPGNNIASIKVQGAHAVVIKLKTSDSQ